MTRFVSDSGASRVVFGSGTFAQLADEAERLDITRAMLVSTPGRAGLARSAEEILRDRVAARFDGAVIHVPSHVAGAARNIALAVNADCLIALGGGSAIGVAKAVALATGIPIIAVPTTYSGSEMTPIWGRTSDGLKQTGRDAKVQPRVVIYDPELTLGLPATVSAASGMNAIAHCIEALYAVDATAASTEAAIRGIELLSKSLPQIVADPGTLTAREAALEGAWLAGFALGCVQMALHHKLCHALGGALDLPHAETHAVLLPYTASFNRQAAAHAMHLAGAALEAADAPTALLGLETRIGTPLSLEKIGMKESEIDRVAGLAVEHEYPNPRPVTKSEIHELLGAAFRGDATYVTSGAWA
ncbi:MAG TPA: maleylacetate reductase [Gemmatimonadaceae bacterium]|nr:maleylacetate reductase [Gemmatimonadaceae bacterium]